MLHRISLIGTLLACLLLWGADTSPVPARALQAITPEGILKHIRILASDEFDGRAPAKTVVILGGDPPIPDPADPSKLDPKMFLGPELSFYGRPGSKADMAYARGASAVITLQGGGAAGGRGGAGRGAARGGAGVGPNR